MSPEQEIAYARPMPMGRRMRSRRVGDVRGAHSEPGLGGETRLMVGTDAPS